MKKLGVIAVLLLVSSQLLEAVAPFKPQPINLRLAGSRLGNLLGDNASWCDAGYYGNFIINNYNNSTVLNNPVFGTLPNIPIFYFCGSYNQSNENQYTPFNTNDWQSGKYTAYMGGWATASSFLPIVFWGAGQIGGACTHNGSKGSFQLAPAPYQPAVQPGQVQHPVYWCIVD
ncbi:MAG TPA: hypothetical protein VJJ81_01920 [Candidatus Babeliales bacterium]|nr:hypothetical protein [Candidatus Babeliales bacterium]